MQASTLSLPAKFCVQDRGGHHEQGSLEMDGL
jgi:hypothetical protein